MTRKGVWVRLMAAQVEGTEVEHLAGGWGFLSPQPPSAE